MHQENLSYLKDLVKYLGFGEHLGVQDELEKVIAKNPKAFNLFTEVYYEEACKLEANLFFRKSDQLNTYFFNKYEAWLRYPDNPERDRGQTFYINKGSGVTFKEAYNLLQGRAVNKDLINLEGEKYNAWIQLNFGERDAYNNYKTRQFRVQYGYSLEKTLENYPIQELEIPNLKEALLRSLKKGNMHPVSFAKTSKTEKMFIEACPQYKTINIYPATSPLIPKTAFQKTMTPVRSTSIASITSEGEKQQDEEMREEKEEVKEGERKPRRRRSPGRRADHNEETDEENSGLLFGTRGAVH